MSSENSPQKINLILCDLPPSITQSDIETFLSEYKSNITEIHINETTPTKAIVTFKDLEIADKCRIELNQKKYKNKNIRIMREEKNFLQKNKDTKNNLYIRNIPKTKQPRELYEYFLKFGDVFSLKVNENDKGEFTGTAFLTYYKEDDAKKCIESTNNQKIWGSDMEVQYQKNTHEKGYNNYNNHNSNFHNNNYGNRNLKINITNLPDNYTDKEISELCEKFGKCEICDIKTNNRNGKFAIVKFSKESEAKAALEKLNNKTIDTKTLIVKELHNYNNQQRYPNYNYNNNYNNKRPGNFPLFYPPNININMNNIPLPKYEDLNINNNLYVTNIPTNATKEDLEKTFGKYGEIDSIKLDEDTSITKEVKEKQKFINKGFGYVSFKKIEDAKKAYESLDGRYLIGFESYFRPLSVDYFIPKEKRNPISQSSNFINMPTPGPMLYPGMQGQFIPQPYIMPIPMNINQMPNNQIRPQQYMYSQGNFKNYGNRRHNNYRGRGSNRGGKNYQKRNNNNVNSNNNINNNEEKTEFDYESYNKLKNDEEKRDFLGEKLFNLIKESNIIKEKKEDDETVSKVTGMILDIPDMKEIIGILESPSQLEERIKEGLELLEKNK